VTAYVALLRGVNVGGRNRVPMEALRKDLDALGYEEVSTYLLSGNALFRAGAHQTHAIRKAVEARLARFMTTEPVVFVRESSQMSRSVKGAPFRGPEREGAHRYVTFLERAPWPGGRLPVSALELDYRLLRGAEVYSVGSRIKGRFGYPGPSLEKALGVRATTRTFAVVQELARRAAALER